MKTIGTKNLFTLTLVLLVTLLAFLSSEARLDQMRFLTNESLFLIALFAVTTGYLVVRFWKLDGPSRTQIGIKRPPAESSETVLLSNSKWIFFIGPNPVHRRLTPSLLTWIFYIYIMAVIGLYTFNNRSLGLIDEFSQQLGDSSGEYCQEKEEEPEDPEKMGCDFLLKAYELGYVKELGNCEPENLDEPVEKQICWLRQPDEPALHYEWRKLVRFFDSMRETYEKQDLNKEKIKLTAQIDAIETIVQPLSAAMNSEPRASHHIFTNLPEPDRDLLRVPDWLAPNRCIEEYGKMPHALPEKKEDPRFVEYTAAQLLFQSKHVPQVGFCRDYAIHWEVKPDLCQRLTENPEAILTEVGIDAEVMSVLNRFETKKKLADLTAIWDVKPEVKVEKKEEPKGKKKKKDKKEAKIYRPEEAISFNCVLVGEMDKDLTESAAVVREFKLPVRSVSIPLNEKQKTEMRSLSYFDPMARVLAPNFQYDRLMSQEIVSQGDIDESTWKTFDPKSYPMTRLEGVFNADLLLGHSWMYSRPDLLEVYPWYKHLYYFVKRFRNEYQKERGRL